MAGGTAHLDPTVSSPRAGAVSGSGPAALRLAGKNDPSSFDWLGLAVCPVGARFNQNAIWCQDSPPSELAMLIGAEAGFGAPSFLGRGHNKSGGGPGGGEPAPTPQGCHWGLLHLFCLVVQHLGNAFSTVRSLLKLGRTSYITDGQPPLCN